MKTLAAYPVSARRDRVYATIVKLAKAGKVPTVRQIAKKLGLLSHSTVHVHITHLLKEGRLEIKNIRDEAYYWPLDSTIPCPFCGTLASTAEPKKGTKR